MKAKQTISLFLLCSWCLLFSTLHAQSTLKWLQSDGVTAGTVNALAASPSENSGVFAGTNVGLFYSADGGAHWLPRGIRAASIHALITDSKVQPTIYAGIGYSSEDGSGGIFRSTDNGVTWQKNLSTEYVWSLASSTNLLCAGTDGNGLFVSTDEGLTWKQNLEDQTVYAVTALGQLIIASTDTAGVFISKDGGATWKNCTLTARGAIYALSSLTGLIVAGGERGVFLSTDGGDSWRNSGLAGQTVWSVLPLSSKLILAGTDTSGVMNFGNSATWAASNLSGESVLALSKTSDGFIAGTLSDGAFVSDASGLEFNDANAGLTAAPIQCFCSMRGSVNAEFAGGDGIAVSRDNGKSWKWLDFYGQVYTLRAVGSVLFAGTDDGYYVSTDFGKTWSQRGLQGQTIYCGINFGAIAFAGTLDSGIYRSIDGGQSWLATTLDSGTVNTMVARHDTIYIGLEDGSLMRSTDSAKTWRRLQRDELNGISSIEFVNDTMIVGTYGNDVYLSTDFGSNWQHRLLNSILETTIYQLSTSNGGVLAATYGHGVYASANGGFDWQPSSAGLDNPYILSIAGLDSQASGVYALASPEGGGIWYAVDSTLSSIIELRDEEEPLHFSPNPVTNHARVYGQGMSMEAVRVTILNIFGQAVMDQKYAPTNLFDVTLDLQYLQNGSYYLQIETASSRRHQMFVVAR